MLKEFIKNLLYLKNALLGTIFADGSLAKQRGNSYKLTTYLEITHTAKNLDYLREVRELLEMLPDTLCSIKEHNKNTESKKYTLFRLSTNSTEYFKQLRDKIYTTIDGKREKLFPKNYIDRFNSLSLYLLYLDDGTLKVRYYPGTSKLREARVTFCLNSFTLKELKDFLSFLDNKYGIKTKYYKFTKSSTIGENRGFVLWTNTENTRKFMEVINKYYNCVPSMQYKFLKYYSL